MVAEDDGRVAGYAGLDRAGEVADVHDDRGRARPRRGAGWGRRLLDELLADARDSGAEHLMLEVRADNAPARRLYAAHGFEE